MFSTKCFSLYSGHLQGDDISVNCNWVDTRWQ